MTDSVYIHIPFCLAKCRYCGFNSFPLAEIGTADRYCQALQREIQISIPTIAKLRTLYLGGGTPTILTVDQLAGLMGHFREPLGPDCEATIEANPETVGQEKLEALKKLGFNRLSLGVQSFDDGLLKALGRVHNAGRAKAAFGQARAAGFENIGIDLIFGLPGQTPEQWRRDLEIAISLGPEHISTYSLTYEPGTKFTAMKEAEIIIPCDEGLEADMYLAAIEKLTIAGYDHYEVSNFAKPGFRSRHNLNYWDCGDYLGFGAGAHSHIGGQRWGNIKDPERYIAGIESNSQVEFEETLTREQQLFEAVFLGLRMMAGIDTGTFKRRWGIWPDEYRPVVWKKNVDSGFIRCENNTYSLTTKGLLLLDSILPEMAP